MKALVSIFVAVGLFVFTGTASANLVLNGGFQDLSGVYSDKGSWRLYPSIAGWTIGGTSGEVELQNGLFGDNKTWYAELDADTNTGNTNVTLSQMLSLVVGQSYSISFDYMNRQGAGVDTGGVFVSLGGWSLQTTGIVNGWSTFTGTFSYDGSASNTLFVQGTGANDKLGALVDNFKVTAVPVPAAVWMLGTGLAAVLGMRRKMTA